MSILKKAQGERNWMIFAVLEPDERGKSGKFPVKAGAMAWPCGWRDSVGLTWEEAQDLIGRINLDKVNQRRGKRIKVVEYVAGYVPQSGSAMVAIDLDDCVEDSEITVDWIRDWVAMTDSWVEVSVSGSGLRVLMERADGDDEWSHAEFNGVGIMGREGKGVTVRLKESLGGDDALRDEAFFQDCVKRRNQGKERRRAEMAEGVTVEDQVLHHGWLSLDDFEDLMWSVPNEGIDFNEWYGLVLAARDYYEIKGDEDMDRLLDMLDQWSETWTDGEHRGEKLRDDVWNRVAREIGVTASLGSWFYHARRAEQGVQKVPDGLGAVKNGADLVARYVMVGDRFFDRLGRQEMTLTTLYRHTINAELISDGPKPKILGAAEAGRKAWINTNVRKFSEFTYLPGEKEEMHGVRVVGRRKIQQGGINTMNWWQPYRLEPEYGDVGVWLDHWRWMYEEEEVEVMLDCLALLLQQPGRKFGFIPIMHGKQGIGKDMALVPVLWALGEDANSNVPFEALHADFNDWAYRKTFVLVQEARKGADRNKSDPEGLAERLKTYAVGLPDSIHINPKGVRAHSAPNVVNMVILTNHINSLFLTGDDRRYFVMRSDVDKKDQAYYETLMAWTERNWKSVVGFLLQRQITRAGDMPPPMTKGKEEMIASSLPPIFDYVEDYADERDWVSIQMVPFDLDAPVSKNPRWRGEQVGKCLEVLGFRFVPYLDGPDKRGRIKVNGRYHRVFVRNELEPDWDEITDVLMRA